jgi:hypothetical protein
MYALSVLTLKELCTLPAAYITVFLKAARINTNCFLNDINQLSMVINMYCFPCGVKGILKYYSGHFAAQDVSTFLVSAAVIKEVPPVATFSTDRLNPTT